MSTIFYCKDAPFLKLGPGIVPGKDQVEFVNGFLVVEDDRVEQVRSWIAHPGTPHIEDLGEDDGGLVHPDIAGPQFPCDHCDKVFGSKFALTGHLRSHAKG